MHLRRHPYSCTRNSPLSQWWLNHVWGWGWGPKHSSLYFVLLSSLELIEAGWITASRGRYKPAFLYPSRRQPDCVIIPTRGLACVVRGIISSLKINLNRPNLKAAFGCNLIKGVMNVSQVFKRRDSRKSQESSAVQITATVGALICWWTWGQLNPSRTGLCVSSAAAGKPTSLWGDSFSEDSCSLGLVFPDYKVG